MLWLGGGAAMFAATAGTCLWLGNNAPDGWLGLAVLPPFIIPPIVQVLMLWLDRRL